jgi:hypothetical protein
LTVVSLLALSTFASQNLQLIARSLAYTLEAAVVFDDRAAVLEVLEQLCKTEEIAHVAVFDSQSRLLASMDAPNSNLLSAAEKTFARLLLPSVVGLRMSAQTVHQAVLLERDDESIDDGATHPEGRRDFRHGEALGGVRKHREDSKPPIEGLRSLLRHRG